MDAIRGDAAGFSGVFAGAACTLVPDETVVQAHVVRQEEHGTVCEAAAAASRVEPERVMIPELEIPFVGRQHLSVPSIAAVCDVLVRVPRVEMDDVLSPAVPM